MHNMSRYINKPKRTASLARHSSKPGLQKYNLNVVELWHIWTVRVQRNKFTLWELWEPAIDYASFRFKYLWSEYSKFISLFLQILQAEGKLSNEPEQFLTEWLAIITYCSQTTTAYNVFKKCNRQPTTRLAQRRIKNLWPTTKPENVRVLKICTQLPFESKSTHTNTSLTNKLAADHSKFLIPN